MALQDIEPMRFGADVFHLFNRQWLVLASGDLAAGAFNAMTISWGSLGIMWDKPIVQVAVRPTRHTHGFMERYPTFTVSAFPEAFRPALDVLGSLSGRDGDKLAEAGVTAVASTRVAAPSFAGAELVLECRTLYSDPLEPKRFLDRSIEAHYPEHDHHTVYVGEIVALRGEARFARR